MVFTVACTSATEVKDPDHGDKKNLRKWKPLMPQVSTIYLSPNSIKMNKKSRTYHWTTLFN